MTVNPAVKVGIIVLLALVAFVSVYMFLNRYSMRRNTYEITAVFDDVKGMPEGSPASMSGVQIGTVNAITLNSKQQAIVHIMISNKYKIPVGSRFVLRVGLLVSDKMLDIVPNRSASTYIPNGAEVKGEMPPSIDDLVPQAQKLMTNLNEITTSVNTVFADKKMQAHFKNSLANIDLVTARLADSMSAIQGTISVESDSIHTIVCNVSSASANLLDLSRRIDDFVKQGGAQENISATFEAARKSAESLERTTSSLEKLTTNPQMQEDVRATIHEARLAVEEARATLHKVGGIFGGGRAPSGTPSGIPTRRTSVDSIFSPDDSKFRVDASTTIPLRDRKFVKLGIYDLGGASRLILQHGQPLDAQTDFRAGIYASRLGVGLDHAFTRKSFGTMNLYDINEPKLDIQAGYDVSDNWGVLLGVDHAFRDNRLAVGVRYTK